MGGEGGIKGRDITGLQQTVPPTPSQVWSLKEFTEGAVTTGVDDWAFQ